MCPNPAAISMTFDFASVGTEIWLYVVPPHAWTVPLVVSATANVFPADTDLNAVFASAFGMLVWPCLFAPQVTRVPFARTPITNDEPIATSMKAFGISVGVRVAVCVGEGVCVTEAVAVEVLVAVRVVVSVRVLVAVYVIVNVREGVAVAVNVVVTVAVRVGVDVAVCVGVLTGDSGGVTVADPIVGMAVVVGVGLSVTLVVCVGVYVTVGVRGSPVGVIVTKRYPWFATEVANTESSVEP